MQNITQFFLDGGIFMYPLAVCSILLLAAILYHWLNSPMNKILPSKLVQLAEKAIATGGEQSLSNLQVAAKNDSSVFATQLNTIFQEASLSNEDLMALLDSKGKDDFLRLQSGISLMDVMVNIAPMLGILGTASGLVIIFTGFGLEHNQANIAQGIAAALNTTISGLAIAAPGFVASALFSRRLERRAAQMERLLTSIITQIPR